FALDDTAHGLGEGTPARAAGEATLQNPKSHLTPADGLVPNSHPAPVVHATAPRRAARTHLVLARHSHDELQATAPRTSRLEQFHVRQQVMLRYDVLGHPRSFRFGLDTQSLREPGDALTYCNDPPWGDKSLPRLPRREILARAFEPNARLDT